MLCARDTVINVDFSREPVGLVSKLAQYFSPTTNRKKRNVFFSSNHIYFFLFLLLCSASYSACSLKLLFTSESGEAMNLSVRFGENLVSR